MMPLVMEVAKILFCDSNAGTQHAVGAVLGRSYALTYVKSVVEAVATAGATLPDIIICELSESSLAAMESWSNVAPEAAVIFTFSNDEVPVSWAFRAGAAYCVPSPVDADTISVLIARALEQRRLRRELADGARRIERELADARRLQQAILPAAEARINGVGMATRWQPCLELSGDLVDYVDYSDAGSAGVAMLIADVSGHGAAAAILMILIKAAFRSCAAEAYAPAAVVSAVTRSIELFGVDRFVTLVAARIDGKSRTIDYVNAGHPPGHLFHRGRVVKDLPATGPLISHAIRHEKWDVAREQMPEHSGVLFYSDGVLDARGDAGRFGSARLVEVIGRHRGGGRPLLDGILTAVTAFASNHLIPDDMTLLTANVGLPGLG